MARFDCEVTRKTVSASHLCVQLFIYVLIAAQFRFYQLGFGCLTVLCCFYFYGPNCLRWRGGLETLPPHLDTRRWPATEIVVYKRLVSSTVDCVNPAEHGLGGVMIRI